MDDSMTTSRAADDQNKVGFWQQFEAEVELERALERAMRAASAEAFGLFAEHFSKVPLFEKAFRLGVETALSDGFGTEPNFQGVETWLWSEEAAELRLEHFGAVGQKFLADVFAAGVRAGYAICRQSPQA